MSPITFSFLMNFVVFLSAGFIIGRRIGKSGWFYAAVTPFFAKLAEALSFAFVIRLSTSWITFLLVEVATALVAGIAGGAFGQATRPKVG